MFDKSYILFDLDGTLTDPKEGLTKSWQYSLREFGINVENRDELTSFIGPPLRDSYREHYGFNAEEVERATEKFREYFTEIGIFECALYDGIDALLKNLQNMGKRIILATSKPLIHAERTLEHFKIDKYFDFVSGCELDGRRSKKSEVIRYALDGMDITDIENAVMIGDRKYDIIGAREFEMDCVGVLYGYGDLQELTDAGAKTIVENVDELTELLTRN
ncbi:MAG: HAD-IA family hydrolase [Oscillospiraceae bacterium]|nr:HAD-IA family hydrolase [Oscillospiraceae bacterium]